MIFIFPSIMSLRNKDRLGMVSIKYGTSSISKLREVPNVGLHSSVFN